jgi:hypothetical protein
MYETVKTHRPDDRHICGSAAPDESAGINITGATEGTAPVKQASTFGGRTM